MLAWRAIDNIKDELVLKLSMDVKNSGHRIVHVAAFLATGITVLVSVAKTICYIFDLPEHFVHTDRQWQRR
jgi:hypothetical protein